MIDLTSLLNLDRIQPEYALQDAIIENKDAILQLNDKQLDIGVDAKGQDLGQYKNFKYKNRFRPIDLKLTGEFRSEEDIIVDDTQMLFVDPDSKTERIMEHFGEDVIGLTEDNIYEAAVILTDPAIENIKRQLT